MLVLPEVESGCSLMVPLPPPFLEPGFSTNPSANRDDATGTGMTAQGLGDSTNLKLGPSLALPVPELKLGPGPGQWPIPAPLAPQQPTHHGDTSAAGHWQALPLSAPHTVSNTTAQLASAHADLPPPDMALRDRLLAENQSLTTQNQVRTLRRVFPLAQP
jgi:hypothetical protein